jgi:hypothetical protein
VAAVEACRRASAVARARADPKTAFAPLSQMLRNGFFLLHGLRIGPSSVAAARNR